jgi:hypothetical protein
MFLINEILDQVRYDKVKRAGFSKVLIMTESKKGSVALEQSVADDVIKSERIENQIQSVVFLCLTNHYIWYILGGRGTQFRLRG